MDKNKILEKLIAGDQEHKDSVIRRGNISANNLSSNSEFIDVMRLVFDITGFDVIAMGVDNNTIVHHNGKREVWQQIRELMGFDAETLKLIELHKQINRNQRGIK